MRLIHQRRSSSSGDVKMLLSKVNRRASAAPQPRKKLFPQNDLKKVSQKRPAPPQIKFPSAAKSLPAAGRNKAKTDVQNRVKATEVDLLPPSDSEEEWGNRSRLETFWRPLHRLNTKEPAENHSVKAQAKVEFDNISKRINKVHKSTVERDIATVECVSRDYLIFIPTRYLMIMSTNNKSRELRYGYLVTLCGLTM